MAGKRLKEIREELGLSQANFAEQLGIGTTTADIERGRTRISGTIVMQLLRDYHINPLWIFGESEQKHLNPNSNDVSPKTISIDNMGQENILLVNEKAAAGYAGNLGDPEYYESLPAFTFPLPDYRHATFRGFQVEGYSMLPALEPGDWIIAKAVTQIDDIKNGSLYIVVDEESIRVKKLFKTPETQQITLLSINPDYPSDTLAYHEVKELWEYHSKITASLPIDTPHHKLDNIHRDVQDIKRALKIE